MKYTNKILSLSAGVLFSLNSMTTVAGEPVGNWQRESVVIIPGEFSTKITWYTGTGAMFITSNFSCIDKDTMYEFHRVQANTSNGMWYFKDDFDFDFLYIGTNDKEHYQYSPYIHSLNTNMLHYNNGTVIPVGIAFEQQRPYTPISAKAEQVVISSWPENSNWSIQSYQSFDLRCSEMPDPDPPVITPPVLRPPRDICNYSYGANRDICR